MGAAKEGSQTGLGPYLRGRWGRWGGGEGTGPYLRGRWGQGRGRSGGGGGRGVDRSIFEGEVGEGEGRLGLEKPWSIFEVRGGGRGPI